MPLLIYTIKCSKGSYLRLCLSFTIHLRVEYWIDLARIWMKVWDYFFEIILIFSLVDSKLPFSAEAMLQGGITCAGFLLIIIWVFPLFLLPSIPLFMLFLLFFVCFRAGIRRFVILCELKNYFFARLMLSWHVFADNLFCGFFGTIFADNFCGF